MTQQPPAAAATAGGGGAVFNIVDEADEDLLCSICLMPWTDPQEFERCGHVLCSACLTDAVKKCPECRGPIIPRKPANRKLVALAERVRMQCEECDWVGPFSATRSHRCGQPSSSVPVASMALPSGSMTSINAPVQPPQLSQQQPYASGAAAVPHAPQPFMVPPERNSATTPAQISPPPPFIAPIDQQPTTVAIGGPELSPPSLAAPVPSLNPASDVDGPRPRRPKYLRVARSRMCALRVLVTSSVLLIVVGLVTIGGAVWLRSKFSPAASVCSGCDLYSEVALGAGGCVAGLGFFGLLSIRLHRRAFVYPFALLLVLLAVVLGAVAVVPWAVGLNRIPWQSMWSVAVQRAPSVVCDIESQLSCSGYSRGCCNPASNGTQQCWTSAAPPSWYASDCPANCGANAATFQTCSAPMNNRVQVAAVAVSSVAGALSVLCFTVMASALRVFGERRWRRVEQLRSETAPLISSRL